MPVVLPKETNEIGQLLPHRGKCLIHVRVGPAADPDLPCPPQQGLDLRLQFGQLAPGDPVGRLHVVRVRIPCPGILLGRARTVHSLEEVQQLGPVERLAYRRVQRGRPTHLDTVADGRAAIGRQDTHREA
jgi:hypothetical protein